MGEEGEPVHGQAVQGEEGDRWTAGIGRNKIWDRILDDI